MNEYKIKYFYIIFMKNYFINLYLNSIVNLDKK